MSTAFDVLLLSQRLPWPPDRGDRITTWNILSHLLGRGLSVRAACFVDATADAPGVAHLRDLGVELATCPLVPWRRRLACLPRLLGGEPLTLPWFRSGRLAAAISAWLDEGAPRLALAYSSSMGQYLLRERDRLAGTARLMHFAELDSDKWRQYAAAARGPAAWVYRREARLLLAYERELARAMDRTSSCPRSSAPCSRSGSPACRSRSCPTASTSSGSGPATPPPACRHADLHQGHGLPPQRRRGRPLRPALWPRVRAARPRPASSSSARTRSPRSAPSTAGTASS
ncbi:MAG: hypothetical protein R3F30_03790 [Planctomycetota bacterium]